MKRSDHFKAEKFDLIKAYSYIVEGNYFYYSSFYILSILEKLLKSPLSIQYFNLFIS